MIFFKAMSILGILADAIMMGENVKLDIDFVREQFPQSNEDYVYCSNAGGSFVARQVLEILEDFNRYKRIQPYSPFSPSREGGELMDRARGLWADALNIKEDELTFGPSTSSNSYVMAQAIGPTLTKQDEIVVCQQDHEANHGAWRRAGERSGATVREWRLLPETGLLDTADLYELLNEKTRWVFFPHCSNLVGTTNPVRDIIEEIRNRCDAFVGVDGVAHVPHHVPDLKALDCDLYLFSLYKVFGPHQGVLYVRSSVGDKLVAQSHHFLTKEPTKRFNPAGPQHAEVAACAGVLDYFRSFMAHHSIVEHDSFNHALQEVRRLFAIHEKKLATPILEFLHQSSKVQLLGKPHCEDGDRAPTIAFRPLKQASEQVTRKMNMLGIGAEHGDFYAGRVLKGMSIDPSDGVVRISLVHYNTEDEVNTIVAGLDQTLAG